MRPGIDTPRLQMQLVGPLSSSDTLVAALSTKIEGGTFNPLAHFALYHQCNDLMLEALLQAFPKCLKHKYMEH